MASFTNPTTMAKRTASQNDQTASNGSGNGESAGVTALVEQGESVKTSLRETLSKTTELIAALKRHRKQSKIVDSTLASLRQLKAIDA